MNKAAFPLAMAISGFVLIYFSLDLTELKMSANLKDHGGSMQTDRYNFLRDAHFKQFLYVGITLFAVGLHRVAAPATDNETP